MDDAKIAIEASALLVNVVIAMVSAAFAAGGAYIATRVELKYLREAISRHERMFERLSERIDNQGKDLHNRINILHDTRNSSVPK